MTKSNPMECVLNSRTNIRISGTLEASQKQNRAE
jgi:hypothetical protein